MNSNGANRRLSVADFVEDSTERDDGKTSFYDPSNPALAPAKPNEAGKKKSWKRKLFGWALVLFLIVGGGFVLYSLLRIKQVKVRVLADNRRDSQNARAAPSPMATENGLSAEAINIAREAMGADTGSANAAHPTPSPGASATPSPSPGSAPRVNYSATLNGLGPANDFGATNNNPNQTNTKETQPNSQQGANTGVISASEQTVQSRANATQSIFVDDSPPKAIATLPRLENSRLPSLAATRTIATKETKTPLAVLPPFGTMLPVRTQGVIFTVRNNGYARLELSRDAQGDGWSLPKGTVLVGHVSGNEYDRAFVNVIGYVDPRENRFVKLSGDVLGSDGATGLQGKRITVDRNRLKQTLSRVASSGLQVAGMAAGALTGRGTVVIDSAGSRVLSPVTDEAGRLVSGGNDKRTFVKVEAGQPGFVMVADLPKELHAVDAPGEDELTRTAISLTDREVMELILFGSPEEIRAALPLMNEAQRQMVVKSLKTDSDK